MSILCEISYTSQAAVRKKPMRKLIMLFVVQVPLPSCTQQNVSTCRRGMVKFCVAFCGLMTARNSLGVHHPLVLHIYASCIMLHAWGAAAHSHCRSLFLEIP